jgi:phytoene desaturase
MKIVVIGAGMGGMATAVRLAAKGHTVEVFEKNVRVGGKLNLLEKDGYRWDTGPSLITMPFVYRDLFNSAGRNFDDYVKLVPVEPVCRYFYPDQTIFDASDSVAAMTSAIEQLNPLDVRAYFRFMAYSRKLYDLTAAVFLFKGFNRWRDLLNLRWRNMFQIDPFRTVHQAVAANFRDPHLVQLFDRYATYNGSSPYLAPATLNIIPYVELGMGGWYVEGGLYALAGAYHKLAEELGVKFRQAEVSQILIEHKQAGGVRLSDGAEVRADVVVANTDATYTYQKLLPSTEHRYKWGRGLTELEPSCSGFVLFLGINQQYPQLAHHNILFSKDYKREFEDIFKRKIPAEDATVYICWTGKTDPTHAPTGHSNLFVLVNAPYLSAAFDWSKPENVRWYRDLIIKTIEDFGLENLSGAIQSEEIMTPLDLAKKYNAEKGAIYGLSSNNRFSAFLRPRNRTKYRNLYLVGGSTHPGGGVPLVTLSAKIVADLIN